MYQSILCVLIPINLLLLLALLTVDFVLHYLSDIDLFILWDVRHLPHQDGILLCQAAFAADNPANFFLLIFAEALAWRLQFLALSLSSFLVLRLATGIASNVGCETSDKGC